MQDPSEQNNFVNTSRLDVAKHFVQGFLSETSSSLLSEETTAGSDDNGGGSLLGCCAAE